MRTAKTLIRLGESDLSLRWMHTHFLVLSCRGSFGLNSLVPFPSVLTNKFERNLKIGAQ